MEQNHTIAALSQAFADYIVTCYEPKAIQDFIQGRYGYLLSKEQQEVGELLQIQLKENSFREEIAQKVRTYLETEDTAMLDGIVRFRLKEYEAHLIQLVDQAVHSYELQKEYDALLLLMRNYVQEQISLYET